MMFYLIAMMFVAYELDKFFRVRSYIQLAKDIEYIGSEKAKPTLNKHAISKLWTKPMIFLVIMEVGYFIWSVVGLFSELRLYYAWILIPPAVGIALGKAYRDKMKAKRDKMPYKIVTSWIFGVVPLGFILYYAWIEGILF